MVAYTKFNLKSRTQLVFAGAVDIEKLDSAETMLESYVWNKIDITTLCEPVGGDSMLSD